MYGQNHGIEGVEEGEGFVADIFAGEQEWWLGDSGRSVDVESAVVAEAEGVFVDGVAELCREFHEW